MQSWRDFLSKRDNKRVDEIDARQHELFAEGELLTRERIFLQEKAKLAMARWEAKQ